MRPFSTLAILLVLATAASAADIRKVKNPGSERQRVTAPGRAVTVYDAGGQPRKAAPGQTITVEGDVVYVDYSGPVPAIEPQETFYAKLAARWAPTWLQDTDDSNTAADYLTPVDFDGDWKTANNWENLDTWRSPALSSLKYAGAAYWWVVETKTHWYIGYGSFHPRDWEDSDGPKNWVKSNIFFPLRSLAGKGSAEHENDMEGALLTVRKDGKNGTLELVDTQAHNQFWQASPRGVLDTIEEDGKKRETIDAGITMDGSRPCVYIEAKGHGNYPMASKTNYDGKKGDGVTYRYGAEGKDAIDYALIPMRRMWDHWRKTRGRNSETFTVKGGRAAFVGDTREPNAANPPWGWSDKDYPKDVNAAFFTDPAKFVTWRFKSASGKPFGLDVVGKSCP